MADEIKLDEAVLAKLKADATLVSLLDNDATRMYRRTAKTPNKIPCITYLSSGAMPDLTVPLHDRVVRITAWESTYEKANAITKRVRALLSRQPLTVLDDNWRFQGIYATADEEEPVEDGELVVNRSLVFRLLAYEVG